MRRSQRKSRTMSLPIRLSSHSYQATFCPVKIKKEIQKKKKKRNNCILAKVLLRRSRLLRRKQLRRNWKKQKFVNNQRSSVFSKWIQASESKRMRWTNSMQSWNRIKIKSINFHYLNCHCASIWDSIEVWPMKRNFKSKLVDQQQARTSHRRIPIRRIFQKKCLNLVCSNKVILRECRSSSNWISLLPWRNKRLTWTKKSVRRNWGKKRLLRRNSTLLRSTRKTIRDSDHSSNSIPKRMNSKSTHQPTRINEFSQGSSQTRNVTRS